MFISIPDRILEKIYFCPISGCWIWDSKWESGNGYGKVWYKKKSCMAHRVVYELCIGKIPENNILDHLCRVRCCVNPQHLEPVTHLENTLRGDAILFKRAA